MYTYQQKCSSLNHFSARESTIAILSLARGFTTTIFLPLSKDCKSARDERETEDQMSERKEGGRMLHLRRRLISAYDQRTSAIQADMRTALLMHQSHHSSLILRLLNRFRDGVQKEAESRRDSPHRSLPAHNSFAAAKAADSFLRRSFPLSTKSS